MDIQTLAHDLGKSVSTLKRWKKQIEHLAEYEFEEKLCKKVINKGEVIWNSDWLDSRTKDIIEMDSNKK